MFISVIGSDVRPRGRGRVGPLGFYTKWMDGRIDDPNAGWKGRAMYADYGQNAIWHTEGGLGAKSAVVKFQIRPNPLAK